MTKRLFLFCLVTAGAFAQQVTSVAYTPASLTHSQVQISFTTTGWLGAGNQLTRVRYGTSSCTGGTGGTVQGDVAPTYLPTQNVDIGGLAPSTTYYICPEVSNDNSTWHGGLAVTVTTPAAPAPWQHPTPPAPPVTFNTDYPDTTGYTIVNEPDCSNFLNDYGNAIRARAAHGTVINLPVNGVACTQQVSQYVLPLDPDVHTFLPPNVNTSTNEITLPTAVNEGQIIHFGATSYTRLPGSGGNNTAGPIISGMPYYWHVTNAGTNTGQVYAGNPFSQGGALSVLTDQGSSSYGIAYVTEPRSPYWVIIRTATPDAQFVAEHSRLQGPLTTDGITSDLYPGQPSQWVPKMAQLQLPYTKITDNQGLLAMGCGDCGVNSFPSHIRWVGIEFSYGPDPYESVSSDPDAWTSLVTTYQEADNIIFDRCWFHAKGTPERVNRAFSWDGTRQAIMDSYIDGMHYFHAAMVGLGISGGTGSKTATIAAGSAGFGAGKGSLTTPAVISWTGAPAGGTQQRAFVYFTMTGNQLNVVFPPGVTGTCTGPANCHVVALTAGVAPGLYLVGGGSGANVFPTNPSPDNYYVDPIVSSSSSCATTTSLFANLNVVAVPPFNGTGVLNVGTTFTADAAQYLCGIQFYKRTSESGSTHTLTAWTTSGTSLRSATTSGETTSGWQSAMFATPLGLAAGSSYVVSGYFNSGTSDGVGQLQNTDYYNANLHAGALYASGNGSGNATDAWPRFVAEIDGTEGPAAGEIAYIDISSAGTIAGVGNADLQNPHSLNSSNEGCQCMVGGVGPGPYIFKDNFIEASGNVWHHDDSGNYWDPGRNDYTYTRNYWHMPAWTWWTGPYSDGNRYGSRHFLEWKAGVRIALVGNIFNRWYTDTTPTDEAVEFSGKRGMTPTDVRIESNTLMHGPGGFLLGAPQETGCCLEPLPEARLLLHNNLAWDIDGMYCVRGGGFACPTQGWFSEGLIGEDNVLDHNTVLLNTANSSTPVFVYMGDLATEGTQVTNNFMISEPSRFSLSGYLVNVDSCINVPQGEGYASCKFTPSYLWAGNAFLGSGLTAAQIESAWPHHITNSNGQPMNYFVGNPSKNVPNAGWFSYNPAKPSAGGNFHLKQGFCSGCGQPGIDLRDVGVDVDALESAQGLVTLNGVPNSSITSTSAMVVFVAPDSAGCSVDYGSTDPAVITQFNRAVDPGGARVRNIVLSGLAAHTVYNYRVNCAVQQPTGQFRTR